MLIPSFFWRNSKGVTEIGGCGGIESSYTPGNLHAGYLNNRVILGEIVMVSPGLKWCELNPDSSIYVELNINRLMLSDQ
jgi:hypothetical protein